MNVLVFDTETTGLPLHPRVQLERQPKIIEFAAAIIDDEGDVVNEYSTLIHPQEQISGEITKITGITNDKLIGQPVFADVVHEIVKLFESADIAVAHNMPFDRFMLDNELKRGSFEMNWPRHMVCTVEESKPLFGYRPKMTQLYANITGEVLMQTHRALDDVLALCDIWIKGGYHDKWLAIAKNTN